jgi:4,5-DOPA dioxygenase extradiol
MAATLGQHVLIENVTGGSGNIATARVARASPDGHTLLLHQMALATRTRYRASVRADIETLIEAASPPHGAACRVPVATRAELLMIVRDLEPVAQAPNRGLDHGAYVPLTVMYPEADIPVLQVSMPTLDPVRLLELGRRLAPLRDEGVLIVGSGFLTHGLPYVDFSDPAGPPPAWSAEFDAWAADALARGAVDELADYANRAPALRYAHPTVEHLAPMFVTLGAADDAEARPETTVDGYWFGLSKRSFQVA